MGFKKYIAVILGSLVLIYCVLVWAEVTNRADILKLNASTIPSNGQTGQLRHDTSDNSLSFYNGTFWGKVTDYRQLVGAELLCTGSSSITDQNNSWLASIGNVSTGDCLLTLSSTYSGTSFISCVSSGNDATPDTNVDVATLTDGTSLLITCKISDTQADCTSFAAFVLCFLK